MKASILLVDDEEAIRQSVGEILRLEGYEVVPVASGEEALAALPTHNFDLVLLDLKMPGIDGIEVLHEINRLSPDTKVILLTAHGSMESAIEALRSSVHDYLLKPASPAQIIESVSRGLERRNARIQARENAQPDLSSDENAIVALSDGTVVDFGRRLVRSGNRVVFLTPAEGRLLRIFVENPSKVYSHRELVLLVQGYSTTQQEAPEILRPLVSRLRQKLTCVPGLMKRIASVRGTGYVFED
jgi:DNA-binding response OmpR family regulator